MADLTHFGEQGRAKMVDVSEKGQTLREATAQAVVRFDAGTYALVMEGKMAKGDVLAVAQVAGIMAAKRTPELIPMCHPIAITGADIYYSFDEGEHSVRIEATVRCKGETGVEMEALTAAAVAALTVYDMCKAAQRDIEISDVYLLEKSGGKSGTYVKE